MLLFIFVNFAKSKGHISLPLLFEDDEISAYKIHDHLWMFYTKKELTNAIFIIEGSNKALIIDSGSTVKDLPSRISRVTNKPPILALTHGHSDHSGSMNQFATVYISPIDKLMIDDYQGTMISVDDGDIIDIGNKTIQVIGLYGHTEGSIGFLDMEDRWLFTGDAIGSSSLWMQTSSLPLEAALDVCWRIEDIEDLFDEIFVGHYAELDYIANMSYVKKMEKLVETILYSKSMNYTIQPFGLPFFPNVVAVTIDGVQVVFNILNLFYRNKLEKNKN